MLSLIAAVLFQLSPVAPELKTYSIDKAHSEINFNAEARFLSAHGYFNSWEAEVKFDPTNVTASSVKITIDSKSITTRNDRRDNHLKSNAFFATDSFPTITFISKQITVTGEGKWDILGDLTIRGVTKTITIPTQQVFYENGRGRFKGNFTVNRMQHGVKYQSRINSIADEIDVQFNLSIIEPKG